MIMNSVESLLMTSTQSFYGQGWRETVDFAEVLSVPNLELKAALSSPSILALKLTTSPHSNIGGNQKIT